MSKGLRAGGPLGSVSEQVEAFDATLRLGSHETRPILHLDQDIQDIWGGIWRMGDGWSPILVGLVGTLDA